MRSPPPLLLPLIVMMSSPAGAAESMGPTPAASVPAQTELFVEIVINGEARGTLARLVQNGDHLWIEPQVLREAGISIDGGEPVDLSAHQGFAARYDAAGQRLLLDVPPALLPLRRISGAKPARVTYSADTGALLNYDAYAQTSENHSTLAVLTEQRLFGPFGALSNTGVLRYGFGPADGYLRYDTSFRRVFEDEATELVAGDLVTRSLPWTTSVRMGGIQVARNFAARPDLITVPLPRFAGETSVPSGVDLFVNGFRQASTRVEAGRFVLDNVPVVNGAGEARVVTTDTVGRQIATVIPFYVAPTLLQPGLTDFAVEAGFVRHGYGTSSFAYGSAAASASVRHGLTDRLTVSGHAEATRGVVGAGFGLAWRAGLLGAFHASIARSSRAAVMGTQVSAGYSYIGRQFSIGIEHVDRSSGYADLGSIGQKRPTGSSRSDRVSGSVLVGGIGSIGTGYVQHRSDDGTKTRLASLSASVPLGRYASAFAAIDHDLDRRRLGAQLRMIVPFGRHETVASAGISRDLRGTMRWSAAFARAVPSDGGPGYSADGAIDDRGRMIGQASATWRGRAFEVESGAAAASASRRAWAGVSGAVVILDGQASLANRLPDAFALVTTGLAGVPVTYENQLLGRTDRRGTLFVPSVSAYHASRFAIETSELPIGMVAPRNERRTALRAGIGAVIRLPVRATRSITLHLTDSDGAPLPPGALATSDSGDELTIGYDGIVLIDSPSNTVVLTAQDRRGTCTARVTIADGLAPLADLGAVRCE